MRTFAEKPSVSQQAWLPKSKVTVQSRLGYSHEQNAHLHTPTKQASQRLRQTNAAEDEGKLPDTTPAHVGQDFSQIPLSSPKATALQMKLAINQAGDEQEQEADRVAEQVMRMSAPQIRPARAYDAAGPNNRMGKKTPGHLGLHSKHATANVSDLPEAPPSVFNVLHSPGQPLDTATRAFMEARFEHDFSRIRVHADAAAAQSAQDINARAYTVGHNIAFARGQFTPATREGQQLLAHELAHTLQQCDGAPTRLARQPMNPRHARGFAGEQGMGFIHYPQEEGWIFFEGPSGSAGHGVTTAGFDGVAYNVRTGEVHLIDNKSLARQGNVGSATAIDPSRNLGKNLDGLIQRVETAKDVPGRIRLLGRLRAAKTALANNQPLPDDVKLVVTGVGGRSTGVSKRLRSKGVDFQPEPAPKSKAAVDPATKLPTSTEKPTARISPASEAETPRVRAPASPEVEPDIPVRARGRVSLTGGKLKISSDDAWSMAGKIGTGASAALSIWGALSAIDGALAQMEKIQSGSVAPQVAAAIKAVKKNFPPADALRADLLWYGQDRDKNYAHAIAWLHNNGVNAMMVKGAALDRMGDELSNVLNYSEDYEKLRDAMKRQSDRIAPLSTELKRRIHVLYEIVNELEKVIPYQLTDTAQTTLWGVRTEFWNAAQDLGKLERIVSARKWAYDREYAEAKKKQRASAEIFNFWAPAFAKLWKKQTGKTASPTNLPVE